MKSTKLKMFLSFLPEMQMGKLRGLPFNTNQFIPIILFLILAAFSSSAQIVGVGSGSYTTQLPPPDAAGRNQNPTGTPRLSGAALTKPVPTADWWTGLLTFNGANLYNYPMSMRAMTNGLVVSYTTPGAGADDTRQPMSGDMPLVVGVSGLSVTNATVSDHSDWTVTANWGDRFYATMGMGMPFVYFTKGASDVASVTVNMGTVSVQSEMILVTNSLGGSNFAVYGPAGSTWTQTGTTYTSTLAGKNYFSVAMLPQGATASTTATAFKQYAYVFPTNTSVSWAYDNATSNMRSTYTVSTAVKEGTGTTVLQALLPHQWAHLSSTSAQPGTYVYTSVRGTMKVLAGNTFVVDNKFKGILPTMPNTAKNSSSFDPGALSAKIDQVKGEQLQLWTDSYNDGLLMNKLVQVARIADQQGNTAARDQIVATVKARLENWLKTDAGENAFMLYYNTQWTTLIPFPAGHYSDTNLNDHHFHYGYFIMAAAAMEQFQPGWAASWGPMVNMLISDAANWDRTNTKFPFLRHFNPYAGHSWAAGLLNNEPHGNNEESSSEGMNFNAALINWGTETGNTAIRDLGIYLYTTQQTAIEEYWFDQSDRNFPSTYAHPIAARVWGNGHDRNTFWTSDIAATFGIEMVPMTAGSFYLGHNTAYVNTLWNYMTSKTGVLSNTPNANLWYDVYWSYLSFIDPALAISRYNSYTNREIKFGESDANTYNWIHAFNAAGQVDASITANYPIAVVFNKAGVKTYVAHNYGASAITVTYSDGFSMSVPARTMKTDKDIDARATLTSSATQIPTNGTVTLSATVSGTVTKVDFYNGTSFLGSRTAAPFTFTTAALSAGKPNFYVRVYNGTAYNLSNVVRVFVGTQSSYTGSPVAIPGIIEAGHYDTFTGGIGQDIVYFDTDAGNSSGTGFRDPEYVDAGATPGEGNTIGWINAGEWMEYTINVANAGTYDVSIRYTSGNSAGGGPFWFENEAGSKISSDITVAMNDVNWTAWTTKLVTGVTLTSGTQIIRVRVGNGGFNLGKMTFTYTGGNVAVTGVTVSPTSASMIPGGTQQLTATIAPSNATNKNVTWTTSNSAVATVSTSGLVTAVAGGTATITVTTQDGLKTATSAITVSSNVAVTGVAVSPTSSSIPAGSTQQLTATVAPSNATNKNVTWTSSNTAVATVNATGLVSAVAVGTSTITVTTQDGAKTATSSITVTNPNPGLPSPWVTSDIGATGVAGTASYSAPTFTAQGSGADIWGAADAFRFVSQTVTGDVTITARVASLGNTDGWAKAGVMVRETTAAGSTHAFTGVTAANGLAFQRRLTTGGQSEHTAGSAGTAPYWVRLTRVGNVISSFVSTTGTTWTQVGTAVSITMTSSVQVGLAVTSHNNTVLSTATFDNVSVTTGNVAVTGVTVSPTSATVLTGATQQLTATVAPSNATNKNVTWTTSNSSIATVSTSGLVTGVALGTATITVTTQDGAKIATSTITVTTGTIAVTGVTVSPTSASIVTGATQQLTATVAPSNATNKTITWTTSNSGVATVSTSGLVTGVAAGTATITVTTQDGGKTATSTITVTAPPTGVDITNLSGGVMSAQYDDSPAAERYPNLIDNNVNTKYLTIHASAWVQFQAPASYVVNRYTLTSANDAAERDPLNWTLQGSTSGTTWVTIDTRSAEDFPSRLQTRSFTFTNTTGYAYYRFNLTNNSGTMLQLAEFELFGTAVSNGVCTGNGPIASGQSVPDYKYEISTSGNVNVKFIPGTPIAGCDLVLFYYRIGTGGYSGFTTTAASGAFTTSVSIPTGSAIQFYFTYRRSAGGMESNSSATPHSYTVGTTCAGARGVEFEEADDSYVLHPNPVEHTLTIKGSAGGRLGIINMQGVEVSNDVMITDDKDVSGLTSGVYNVILIKNSKRIIKRFVKK
jgi:uncharacterized protein YjdB/endoglucanase Acf2